MLSTALDDCRIGADCRSVFCRTADTPMPVAVDSDEEW
jgi:hypothetical protein